MTQPKEYEKGDWIVHVNYGVGQVKGLEKKRLGEKDRLYYRIECNDGTFWLSQKKADPQRVRPVASRDNLQKAIQALAERPKKLDENNKKRQALVNEVRTQGSIIPMASLVRDMYYGKTTGRLTPTEEGVLEDLEKRLIMEWSVVLDIKPEEARTQLDQLLLSHTGRSHAGK
jgi:RNA polymerase-interacting CarD/CdnL/TRCF family regulator